MVEATNQPSSPAPSGDPPAPPRAAERVLAYMQPALGHDLPNLLVAVQGLLQILELDERDRLSSDGRDYLRRLSATTQRAQALVRMLKDLGRASQDAGLVEK